MKIVISILILVLIIMFIFTIYKNDLLWSFFALIMIFIAFIPTIFRYNLKIKLPYLFDVFICLALIFHMGNGLLDISGIFSIYNKFTHFFSACVIAFIFLILLFVFNEYYRGIAVNKFKIMFDVVVITMAFGVVWEFMEWVSDFFFNLGAQPSLDDTMGDLFADTLGGLLIAFIGYILIKRGILKNFSNNLKKHFDEIIDHD
jgi:hypothetical protein